MTRGVRWYLVSSLVLVALVAVAGCSHYMLAEREPWRHEAEVACLNSGAVNDTAGRVRIAAIEGPGACGIDYPLRVSALGESAPLSYDDEAAVPPGSIPNASMPQNWPGASPSNSIEPSAGAAIRRAAIVPFVAPLPGAAALPRTASDGANRPTAVARPAGPAADRRQR